MRNFVLFLFGIGLSTVCLAESQSCDTNYSYEVVSSQTHVPYFSSGSCEEDIQDLCSSKNGELIKIQWMRSFCLGICRTAETSMPKTR
jgi:hypothetical protein